MVINDMSCLVVFTEQGKGSVDLNQKDIYNRTAIVALFWNQTLMFETRAKDKL